MERMEESEGLSSESLSDSEDDFGSAGRAQRMVDDVNNVVISVHSKGRLYIAILGGTNLGDSNYFANVRYGDVSYPTTISMGPTTEWNEEFCFLVTDTNINLVLELHEIEKKKRKTDVILGSLSIPVKDMKQGEVVREVLTINPKKGKEHEKGLLFYRVVYEGDMAYGRYIPLEDLCMSKGFLILHALCNEVDLEDATWLSPALVAILVWNQKALSFFQTALLDEVRKTTSEGLLFRGQNLTIKALSIFSHQVGRTYLIEILQPFFLEMESELLEDGTFPWDFELDPKRGGSKRKAKGNLPSVLKWVTKLLDSIFRSVESIDPILLHLCAHLRKCVEIHFPDGLMSVLSGFFFLRFVCPIVVTPETLPGLRADPPSESMRRLLVLVTKIVQNVASGVEFGEKEAYMRCCNSYIREMKTRIDHFYQQISDPDNTNKPIKLPRTPTQRHSYHLLHVAISSYDICEKLPPSQEKLKSLLRNALNKLGTPAKDQKAVDLLGYVDLEKISERIKDPRTGVLTFNLHSPHTTNEKNKKKADSFSAFDMIDWLCVNVPICNTRNDAVSLGNKLLDFHFISPVSSDVFCFADEEMFFEFSQELSPSSSGKVALNMRKIVTKKDVYGNDGLKETSSPHSVRAPTSCPIELSSELLETITRVLHSLSSLVEHEIRPAMLSSIRDFAKFKVFCLTTCYLQVIDLFQLKTDTEKTSFWLNIYHTLMLHAHAELGSPPSSSGLAKLMTTASYNIGGHLFSLSEIEHCILRASLPSPKSTNVLLGGGSRRFGKKDLRSRLAVTKSNPLISFGINYGGASSCLLDHYLPYNVEERLAANASNFLNSTVSIVKEKGAVRVMVPRVVRWFGQDYGRDKYEQLRFIARILDPSTPGFDDLKAALRPYDNKLKVNLDPLSYDPVFLCDLSQVVGRFGATMTSTSRTSRTRSFPSPVISDEVSGNSFTATSEDPSLMTNGTQTRTSESTTKEITPPAFSRSPKTRASRKRQSIGDTTQATRSPRQREENTLLYDEIKRLKEEIAMLKEKNEQAQSSSPRDGPSLSTTPPLFSSFSSSWGKDEGSSGSDKESEKVEKKGAYLSFKNVEINEKIGNGGSGCVVHACQVDGWQCALKVLSTDGVSVNQVTQFEKEVLFLESLPPHRNLVQYLHHERTRGSIRLYMRRYYSTLRSFMQSLPEPLSRKDLTGICLDVAVGLSILHKNKIIHRDLKTDNLFVTLDGMGAYSYCSVGDFDSAKRLSAGVKAKTIVGTPGYMAPEIYTPDYSYPVDVWSFGVIMYELFRHGRKEAEDWPMYRVQDQLRHDFPFPIEPEFETFTKIIQKCLHKTPKKRPTFEALKQEFLELSISSFR